MKSHSKTVLVGMAALVAAGVMTAGAGAATPKNCGAQPDAHARWEVVFTTEPSEAHALNEQRKAAKQGFVTHIEVDSCTQWEVSVAKFSSRPAALVLLAQAKAAGWKKAHTEDS
jgi:hypothetical protein